jgi:hypothetical protein
MNQDLNSESRYWKAKMNLKKFEELDVLSGGFVASVKAWKSFLEA